MSQSEVGGQPSCLTTAAEQSSPARPLPPATSATDRVGTASDTSHSNEDDCTLFLRNLPVRCRSDEVLASLAGLGFDRSTIAFFNMPSRPNKPTRKSHNRGYCFVRFINPEVCRQFIEATEHGFRIESRSSDKLVTVERVRRPRGQHTEAPPYTFRRTDTEIEVLELSL